MSLAEILRSRTIDAVPQGPDNLIAIASGKGGVGKTMLAVALAHAMTLAGRRILLFDGDFGLANTHIHMGLMPKIDIVQCLIKRQGLAGAIGRVESLGFDLIPGRSGLGGMTSLPRNTLRALQTELISLSRQYDIVIVDLGAGIDRTVLETINCAGRYITVTTQDPASLTDAYALIKAAHRLRSHPGLSIVVNMALSLNNGLATFETLRSVCRRFLSIDPGFLGCVRRDDRVGRAIHMQTPLLQHFPNSTAARDIRYIAERLI